MEEQEIKRTSDSSLFSGVIIEGKDFFYLLCPCCRAMERCPSFSEVDMICLKCDAHRVALPAIPGIVPPESPSDRK